MGFSIPASLVTFLQPTNGLCISFLLLSICHQMLGRGGEWGRGKVELGQCVWILWSLSFFPLSFIKPNSPNLTMTLGMVVRGCVFQVWVGFRFSWENSLRPVCQSRSVQTQGRSVGEIPKLCAVESLSLGVAPLPGDSGHILGHTAWVLDSLCFWKWQECQEDAPKRYAHSVLDCLPYTVVLNPHTTTGEEIIYTLATKYDRLSTWLRLGSNPWDQIPALSPTQVLSIPVDASGAEKCFP